MKIFVPSFLAGAFVFAVLVTTMPPESWLYIGVDRYCNDTPAEKALVMERFASRTDATIEIHCGDD